MEGTILHVYPNQQKGMIRSDDGSQLPFRRSNLRGVAFHALFSGLRVSYQIQDGWLGKEAVAVRPVAEHRGPEER
jgi:cold shock CspA family protein